MERTMMMTMTMEKQRGGSETETETLDAEEEMGRKSPSPPSPSSSSSEERSALLKQDTRLYQTHFPGVLKKYAYRFDGEGNYADKDWDLEEGRGREFCWYHVELPKGDQKLSQNAQYLIDVLCPPLKLHDILALVGNGPHCGHVDQALVFRVNSPGPPSGNFTIRLAARVTPNSVITVSLGRIPRMGFSRSRIPLLNDVPLVGSNTSSYFTRDEGSSHTFIDEHLLEFLLRMDHSEEADNPVPTTVSNLVVHIIDTYVDHVHDVVTNLEMELETVELELERGGFSAKKQMLDDRRFAKMHLNLQRLLQVVAHSEQIFPRVKEKLANKSWFANEDLLYLEELVSRLRRLKENLGFIVNRVAAVHTGLDSWQSEQINRKLYYLSLLSIIFLPLSIVTGIFGMNVGGVPWTGQRGSSLDGGFRNVLFICAAISLFILFCFSFPAIYSRISAWRRRWSLKRSYSLNRKSFLKKIVRGHATRGRDYIQI